MTHESTAFPPATSHQPPATSHLHPSLCFSASPPRLTSPHSSCSTILRPTYTFPSSTHLTLGPDYLARSRSLL
ncbi:hypothetical protein E2C01_077176 [Portunus trituberculatus]|uniref:Uncharacterized protein n=1 Tax=Portunus trituberculatus TaxID=210409 RepID=A0A5B7IJJ9_PORTR|nr:hypothetical protein [Portunus trituberculatus]